MLGHSYNFLFCGLKINSALPGGRAGKNAIGHNNTLNTQHVKVLSELITERFVNDFELINLHGDRKERASRLFVTDIFPVSL
ncbi:MAG: hypothetical protein MUO77_08105 [Anaerolineales bacterium]|nr:hypothetical protein [Anaerolineales bacterium]